MVACQIEFPLEVAVCAWCKPRRRDPLPRTLSHGICPRHLKKLKLELQKRLVGRSARGAAQPLRQPQIPVQTDLVYLG